MLVRVPLFVGQGLAPRRDSLGPPESGAVVEGGASVPAPMATGRCDVVFLFFSFFTWNASADRCSLRPPSALKLSMHFQPNSLIYIPALQS